MAELVIVITVDHLLALFLLGMTDVRSLPAVSTSLLSEADPSLNGF